MFHACILVTINVTRIHFFMPIHINYTFFLLIFLFLEPLLTWKSCLSRRRSEDIFFKIIICSAWEHRILPSKIILITQYNEMYGVVTISQFCTVPGIQLLRGPIIDRCTQFRVYTEINKHFVRGAHGREKVRGHLPPPHPQKITKKNQEEEKKLRLK